MILRLSAVFLCLFLSNLPNSFCQSIILNEVAPTNNTFLDEEEETKDWIELYNTANEAINIENWSISDDKTDPQKWLFPAIEIAPNEFFTFFASGKDRKKLLTYRTILQQGDACKYIIPDASTSSNWRTKDFDDTNWKGGATGIGYGDGDDNTVVPAQTRSVFVRQKFTLTDLSQIEEIIFQVDYDDGFVAYLNGIEIGRANIDGGAFPNYFTGVICDREAELYQGISPTKLTFKNVAELLVEGENVLAVQVHNVNTFSSDLTIIPFLSLGSKTPLTIGQEVPDLLKLLPSFLHTNFKIGSEETIYLFNAAKELQDSLYIPKLANNITVGRFPDGANNSQFFEENTPNAPNSVNYFEQIITDEVTFSQSSGIFEEGFSLALSTTSEEGAIRFTTDGTMPTSISNIYQNPIQIRLSSTVKAGIFKEGYIPSEITTQSYLIDVDHDLPVLSIAFNNADFFSETTGMYSFGNDYEDDLPFFGANFWKDLEKPIHLTFLESGEVGFSTGAGAKIFGGWSRANSQRSLSIFFRNEYGDKNLKYSLFPQRNYDKYEAFILRNSGNDWQRTMLRDLTLTGLMEDSNVDIQAGRPVVTYLNGAYWGIYNAREKINEHYLAALHNVPTKDITILEKNADVIFGDNQEYQTLINFINSESMAIPTNYERVEKEIDLANYIQYQAAQIYFDNTDWPGNNIKFWKHKNGKWRWILFDTDFGFGIWNAEQYNNNTLAFALEPNGPGWPNPSWSTLLFRELMENETFKKRFINTFADELNTRFLNANVRAKIEANETILSKEMPAHIEKWGQTSMTAWRSKVNDMKKFAGQRTAFMRTFIRQEFNLPIQKLVNLSISSPDAGSIQLNTIRITNSQWTGFYFPSVPITLTAIAKPGYIFSHWSGANNTTEKTIIIDPTNTVQLKANFIPAETENPANSVVFNEINYNSTEEVDAGDWVELYNNGSEQDLSDWMFKDDDDEHIFTFPIGTILKADEYLVLTKDSDKFATEFPEVTNFIGNFDFGLSSKGEFIRLFDANSNLVDSVFYLPENPWPAAADGAGPSLELINPDSDNTLPENWIIFTANGTPGQPNGVYTSINNAPELATFINLHPNPFEEQITLNVDLPKRSDLQIDLLNMNGQLIQQLVQQKAVQQAEFELAIPDMAAGNYLIRIRVNGKQLIKKLVKK
ncbi:MAG: CotH kinase family protein [Saprospiraceae bacterium]